MDRSTFNFKINGDVEQTRQLIQGFISGNGFVPEQDYYILKDLMSGNKYFSYSINGNNLTINAWLKGIKGDVSLERAGSLMEGMNYRDLLNKLFNEINRLNGTANVGVQDSNQYVRDFQDDTLKKKEKQCEVGFWLSIVGVVLSLFGYMLGVLIYVFCFYFGFQGLKTGKRKKAIATIALSIISILIIVLELIFLGPAQ